MTIRGVPLYTTMPPKGGILFQISSLTGYAGEVIPVLRPLRPAYEVKDDGH